LKIGNLRQIKLRCASAVKA